MTTKRSSKPVPKLLAGRPDSSIAAIVFGASRFPHYGEIDSVDLAAPLAESRRQITEQLVTFCRDVLDTFDTDLAPAEICLGIADHLDRSAAYSDLILYYVGHGGFLDSQEYFLALRRTELEQRHVTGLRIKDLASTLDKQIKSRRRIYLILDCCFAARAVPAFLSPLADVIHAGAEQLPTGLSLLAASSRSHAALAPAGSACTMFTGALIDVLRDGVTGPAGGLLSLRQITDATRARIQQVHGERAVRPEIHSPLQRNGDPADHAIFPNRCAPAANRALSGSVPPVAGQTSQAVVDELGYPGAYHPIWHVDRAQRRDAEGCLSIAGNALMLWGPAMCGKSWMRKHLCAIERGSAPVTAIVVDLEALAHVGDDRTAAFVAALVMGAEDGATLRTIGGSDKAWFEQADAILKARAQRQSGTLVLALENTDVIALWQPPARDALFARLRGWVENTGRLGWLDAFRLVVISRCPPEELGTTPGISPLQNVATQVRLEQFERPEIELLAARYRLRWEEDDYKAIDDYLSGQPYLVRRVMYDCVAGSQAKKGLRSLLRSKAALRYLDRHAAWLSRHPKAQFALASVVKHAGSTDAAALKQLVNYGLVLRSGDSYRLACRLYRQLCRSRL